VRNIVLMRPIGSIVEFKQIIGRGTRLFQGKDYFTIFDFVKAYRHCNDPVWDGEPVEPEEERPREPRERDQEDSKGGPAGRDDEDKGRPQPLKIKLADGKERAMQHMAARTFRGPDGRPMSRDGVLSKF
jgi:type I restriction enzyme R subunit